jgi:hypothetical protein
LGQANEDADVAEGIGLGAEAQLLREHGSSSRESTVQECRNQPSNFETVGLPKSDLGENRDALVYPEVLD